MFKDDMYPKIVEYSESIQDELVSFRRDLHKHPEVGWLEIRTTFKIYEELSKLDCTIIMGEDVTDHEFKMGLPKQEEFDRAYDFARQNGVPQDFADKVKNSNTGLIVIFENGEGPTTGMRFDIDALPLFEDENDSHYPKKNGFASVNHGYMHACGHDGHATIGLGVAKTINRFKDSFRGKIKLIFQPAEEGVRGAKSIVKKGHLDDVKYFFASHITDNSSHTEYDLFPGSEGALATTKLDVEFHGKSSHAGGAPQNGRNAMLGLATSIMNIYSVPRHSEGATRVNVGLANSGTGRNIISDYAKFLVETRGSNTKINNYVKDYVLNVIEGAAKMHNLEYKVSLEGEADSFNSDIEIIHIIREVANKLNLRPTAEDKMQLNGSEDVSYMIKKVQENGGLGSFIRILTPQKAQAHNISYDFDEQIISKAVSVFVGSAYKITQGL